MIPATRLHHFRFWISKIVKHLTFTAQSVQGNDNIVQPQIYMGLIIINRNG
jgi:hypothetical protein